MSVLHHEEIFEDCFNIARESFKVHNKLTEQQMEELLSFSEGAADAIEKSARLMFENMCQ